MTRTTQKRRRRNQRRRRSENELVATQLRSHLRSTKSTRGGSALGITKSPHVFASGTSSQTLLSTPHHHSQSARSVFQRDAVPRARFRSFHHLPQPLLMISASPLPRSLRWTISLTTDTLVCAWRRRETKTSHARKGKNAPLARDASTKRGDSVPGSQDSLARQVRNLQLSDTSAPSPMPHSRRPPQARPRQQPQEYRRCAQCGPDPSACRGASDHGLMPHMVQKHGGQRLIQENVTQLRHLDQSACVACVSFQVATMSPLQLLQKRYSTPRLYYWRHLSGPSTIRTPGCRARQLAHRSPASSQPAPPGDSLDDTPLPSCPIRDIVLIERDKQLLAELRRASAMALPRCTVSRYATAWTESLEGAISGHQSWAVLCRYRCRLLLPEVTKDTDRNAELKLRLQDWEAGEVSELIAKNVGAATLWSASQERTSNAATNGRTTWQTSLRLDGHRIHQQSH